jgi:hypothetical protein
VLLSSSRNAATPAIGRGWEETEECVDPQSGRLVVHSQAPGLYAVYDYANAAQLGGHVLARRVTIVEGGKVVATISVESLGAISAADPNTFVPTEGMKAAGRATAMSATTKMSRIHSAGSVTTVCVFGVVTPTGQLVEAHSLQPSDPNSQAAVEDATRIDFSPTIRGGAPPRQHFVFVIEKFVSGQ